MTPVVLPDDVEIVVVHTAQDRALAASTSVERRAEYAAAEAFVGPLRSASTADVEQITDPLVRRRARSVVSEGRRVRAAVEALAAGDVVELGRLLGESHASVRDDFEVSDADRRQRRQPARPDARRARRPRDGRRLRGVRGGPGPAGDPAGARPRRHRAPCCGRRRGAGLNTTRDRRRAVSPRRPDALRCGCSTGC